MSNFIVCLIAAAKDGLTKNELAEKYYNYVGKSLSKKDALFYVEMLTHDAILDNSIVLVDGLYKLKLAKKIMLARIQKDIIKVIINLGCDAFIQDIQSRLFDLEGTIIYWKFSNYDCITEGLRILELKGIITKSMKHGVIYYNLSDDCIISALFH
jgi:hypothetical protein